jgi:hypothetical protein
MSPAGHGNVAPTGYGRPVGPLTTLFGNLVLHLPVLAVLIVGLVLVSSPGRLPARGARLARAGLLLMLANEVLSLVWSVFFPHVLIRRTFSGGRVSIAAAGYLNAAVSLVLSVILAAGLALLIFGLVTARRAPASPAPYEQAPYEQASYEYAPSGPVPVEPAPVPFPPPDATGRIVPEAHDPWSGDHRAQ